MGIGCLHLVSDKTGFFLYHLMDSSSEEEVQAQEEKLKAYFSQLKTQVRWDNEKRCSVQVIFKYKGEVFLIRSVG